MALTEQQQKDFNRLSGDLDLTDVQLKAGNQEINKPDPLTKLVTGGKKVDFTSFTDDELRDVYDRVARSSSLNTLWDGYDPEFGKTGETHPSSYLAISERGELTKDMSRKDMIRDMSAIMEEYGHDMSPLLIAESQNMLVNARSAEIDGRILNVAMAVEKMEEEQGQPIPELDPLKERIQLLKSQGKSFGQASEHKITENVQRGLETTLEQFAKKGEPLDAKKMAALIETAKNKLDAANLSGRNDHVLKMEKAEIDLSSMNLKGCDLSKSDLTGFKVHPQTLAKAKNFTQAKGIDAPTMDMAKSFDKVAKLEAEIDKLRKPSLWEKIKALPSGGIEKAKEKLITQVDELKMQLHQKLDPQSFNQLQKQNTTSVEGLKKEQGNYEKQAVDHKQAQEQLRSVQVTLAIGTSGAIGPVLSNSEVKQLELEREQAAKVIQETQVGADRHKQLGNEVTALEKNMTVREKLGQSIGEKVDVPKPGLKVN
jgi:hypothetical protein